MRPKFFQFQLLGDSILQRFSTNLLDEEVEVNGNVRSIGYCVSGQTSGQLLSRLKDNYYPLSGKVVLMIGTNDILQNRPIKEFQSNLKGILELLTRNANVTVLTIPPIMKFGKNQGSIKAANEVVKIEAANYPSQVQVVDCFHHFLDPNGYPNSNLFEQCYRNGRPDKIHPNIKGLSKIFFMLSKFLYPNA